MKKVFFIIIVILVSGAAGYFFLVHQQGVISPLSTKKTQEKPLDKYTFDRLKKTTFSSSAITLDKEFKKENSYISQLFWYSVEGKKVSGLINVPTEPGTYPIIILFRGFVAVDEYTTGIGTQRVGETLARNGFITLAPDFLGYGKSDNPSSDSIEERFQTYTTALTLLSSLEKLNEGLQASYSGTIVADIEKIGIWGHSNGGHIALSVLAITNKEYPTVLWNPVSKPFPYSVLYFTDEFEDNGKALRRVIANFEKDYDIEKYSPTNFYKNIQAPIQLHQGEADDAVPVKWSNQLYLTLQKLEKDITYYTYSGADHNLAPTGWTTAVQRSIVFFAQHLLNR